MFARDAHRIGDGRDVDDRRTVGLQPCEHLRLTRPDISPPQTEQLGLAQAGHRHGDHHDPAALARGRPAVAVVLALGAPAGWASACG